MEKLSLVDSSRIIAILEDSIEKLSFLDRYPFITASSSHIHPDIDDIDGIASHLIFFNIEMNYQNLSEMKLQKQ